MGSGGINEGWKVGELVRIWGMSEEWRNSENWGG